MMEKQTTFLLKLVVHLLIENIPGCRLHLTFFVIVIAMVRGVGGWGGVPPTVWKMQTLKITLRSPTHVSSQKKELKVLKENMQSQQQKNTTGYSYCACDFIVCGFNEQTAFFCQRILPDICHWNSVVPKLNQFWRYCVLPCVFEKLTLELRRSAEINFGPLQKL